MVCVECGRVLSGDSGIDSLCDWIAVVSRGAIQSGEWQVVCGSGDWRVGAQYLYSIGDSEWKALQQVVLCCIDDLMAGGELVFQMGPRPNLEWGTGAGNEPVSRIAGR